MTNRLTAFFPNRVRDGVSSRVKDKFLQVKRNSLKVLAWLVSSFQ